MKTETEKFIAWLKSLSSDSDRADEIAEVRCYVCQFCGRPLEETEVCYCTRGE